MWTNALYINNLVPLDDNFDRMCAAWTYVTVCKCLFRRCIAVQQTAANNFYIAHEL